MHLIVVELNTKNHWTLIYNWACISKLNGWKYSIATTPEIFENVKPELAGFSYNVWLCENDKYASFCRKIKQQCVLEQDCFVLFLTMQGCFSSLLWNWFSGVKVGLTIHNAHTWFVSDRIVKFKSYLRRFFRILWKRRACLFFVNSDNMKEYVDKYNKTGKDVVVMPFSLKKQQKRRIESSGEFIVVYPGTVSTSRKKYDNFLRLARDFTKVKFVLLGRIKGESSIKSEVEKLSNVVFFEDYIDISEFNSWLDKANVLFSELVVRYQNGEYSEVYGRTKDSGISYLMNEWNLKCLLNAEFQNLLCLKENSIYFKGYMDLKQAFKQLLTKNQFNLNDACGLEGISYYADKVKIIESLV